MLTHSGGNEGSRELARDWVACRQSEGSNKSRYARIKQRPKVNVSQAPSLCWGPRHGLRSPGTPTNVLPKQNVLRLPINVSSTSVFCTETYQHYCAASPPFIIIQTTPSTETPVVPLRTPPPHPPPSHMIQAHPQFGVHHTIHPSLLGNLFNQARRHFSPTQPFRGHSRTKPATPRHAYIAFQESGLARPSCSLST